MDETVYRQLVAEGQLDAGKVKVFHTGPPFADYVWAARKGLGRDEKTAFTKAMLALNRGKDHTVLDILRGDTFVPADGNAYGNVEATARELKLL